MRHARVLLLGAAGLLGTAIKKIFLSQNIEVTGLTRAEFDASHDKVDKLDQYGEHEYLINCIAFHKVDQCEHEISSAFDLNCRFVHDLALYCSEHVSTLIHVSTDYVFDGSKPGPYSETDMAEPLNVYGISKLAGEKAALAYSRRSFVLRVSSLFGHRSTMNQPPHFVDKILSQASKGTLIKVIDDQIMSPTFTDDVARAMEAIIKNRMSDYGLYHCSNSGECSWFEFAEEILRQAELEAEIHPVSVKEFHSSVRRPQFCSLNNDRINALYKMRHWTEALSLYMKNREVVRGGN